MDMTAKLYDKTEKNGTVIYRPRNVINVYAGQTWVKMRVPLSDLGHRKVKRMLEQIIADADKHARTDDPPSKYLLLTSKENDVNTLNDELRNMKNGREKRDGACIAGVFATTLLAPTASWAYFGYMLDKTNPYTDMFLFGSIGFILASYVVEKLAAPLGHYLGYRNARFYEKLYRLTIKHEKRLKSEQPESKWGA